MICTDSAAQNFVNFLIDMNVFLTFDLTTCFQQRKYFILEHLLQPMAFYSKVDQSDRSDLNEVGESG